MHFRGGEKTFERTLDNYDNCGTITFERSISVATISVIKKMYEYCYAFLSEPRCQQLAPEVVLILMRRLTFILLRPRSDDRLLKSYLHSLRNKHRERSALFNGCATRRCRCLALHAARYFKVSRAISSDLSRR